MGDQNASIHGIQLPRNDGNLESPYLHYGEGIQACVFFGGCPVFGGSKEKPRGKPPFLLGEYPAALNIASKPLKKRKTIYHNFHLLKLMILKCSPVGFKGSKNQTEGGIHRSTCCCSPGYAWSLKVHSERSL